MKYSITLFSILGMLLAACSGDSGNSDGASERNSISGTIKGASGETLVLQRFSNNVAIASDSVIVAEDGSFEIRPSFGMPLDYYSLLLRQSNTFMILLSDSTENITIDTDVESFQFGAEVSGSENTTKLLDFYKQMEEFSAQEQAIQEEVQQLSSTYDKGSPEISKVSAKVSQLKRDRRTFAMDFLRDESPSPAIMAALTELNINVDLSLFEKAYADLQKDFGHSYYHQMVGKRIQDAKVKQRARQQQQNQTQAGGRNNKYQVGSVPPNLVFPDPKGKTRGLYDLRGKYVLIDFWASWCGPCRRENPNVVRLYNQYKDKGFDIFSVSLDKQQDRWVKAIQQDNLIWPNHVSDLKGWNSAASQSYGVSSIPHTLLLDPNGTVIGAGLRGPQLEQKLAEIFGG